MLNAPGSLLPDRLKQLWAGAETADADLTWREQERFIDEDRHIWADALRLEDRADLKTSLLSEVGAYVGLYYLDEVERRCRRAVHAVRDEWEQRGTDATDCNDVETFYDQSEAYIFDLMWWHTLLDDPSPLVYVVALRFGAQRGCRRYLDFGSGVGLASIVARRHGYDVTLADISSSLLAFAKWRFDRRGLDAEFVDLKRHRLEPGGYDLVTAMDVWEHLVDPVATVDTLADAMTPGGFLDARFAAEEDPNYPQHIVTNFQPTFDRLAERGFKEVWRDDWLWGHQVFQKEP